MDGPDFICAGMPKTGTGWLYDQLNAHPDFWMPPVKELVYLDHRYPPLRFVRDGCKKLRANRKEGTATDVPLERPATGERRFHRLTIDDRDIRFLDHARKGRGRERDLDFYASLFEAKGDLLSGDISPTYCTLNTEIIASVARRLPHAKIILLVRDPIARTWSRICMSYEGKGFDTGLLNDRAAFRAHLEGVHKLGGLFATKVYQRWREAAPGMMFRVFFFDDIAAAPEKIRAGILHFLGADPNKKSDRVPPGYNRKAKTKLEMPAFARDVLIDHFRDELEASAAIFGGPALKWPKQYGL